jgi:hypothetical protein
MPWDVIRQVDERKPAEVESDIEMDDGRVKYQKGAEGTYMRR